MVGYRNFKAELARLGVDFIRHSDGGVSERHQACAPHRLRLYQAFRWWGIGTVCFMASASRRTLSGIPMVGYRNEIEFDLERIDDFIRHSDGGVSEHPAIAARDYDRLYQAFRWWGIGTNERYSAEALATLSGIPMVGYRNTPPGMARHPCDFIRHSDGGVSEQQPQQDGDGRRLYQAFRWWGIGTTSTSGA